MENQSLNEIEFRGNWQEYFFKLYQYLYLHPDCVQGLHLLAKSYKLSGREKMGTEKGERVIERGIKRTLPIYMKILELNPDDEEAKGEVFIDNIGFYALSSMQTKNEILELLDKDKEEFPKDFNEMILEGSFSLFGDLHKAALSETKADFLESVHTLYTKYQTVQRALASIDLDIDVYSALYEKDRDRRDVEISKLVAQKVILLEEYSNYSISEISSSIVQYADKLVFEIRSYYLEFARIFLESGHIDAMLSCLQRYLGDNIDHMFKLSAKEVNYWYTAIVELKNQPSFNQQKRATQIAIEELILFMESELTTILTISHDKFLSTIAYCIKKYPDQSFGYYYKGLYHYRNDDYGLATENFEKALKNKFTAAAAYHYLRSAYQGEIPIKPFAFGENQPRQMLEFSWELLFDIQDITFENEEELRKANKLLFRFFKCTWDNFDLYYTKDTFISLDECSLDRWLDCGEDIVSICFKLKWYKRALFYIDLTLKIKDNLAMHKAKLRCLVALEKFDQAIQYYEDFIISKHPFKLDKWSKVYLSSFYLKAKLSNGLTPQLYSKAKELLKKINKKAQSIAKEKFVQGVGFSGLDCEDQTLIEEILQSRIALESILVALYYN